MTTSRPRTSGIRRTAVALASAATFAMILVSCAATPAAEPTSAAPIPPAISRSAAPAGELPAELVSELQQTLDDTMAEYDVPGAAVGVWIPGEGSWTAVAGLADVETAMSRVDARHACGRSAASRSPTR